MARDFEKDEYDDFFETVDVSGDGLISKGEMKHFFIKMNYMM